MTTTLQTQISSEMLPQHLETQYQELYDLADTIGEMYSTTKKYEIVDLKIHLQVEMFAGGGMGCCGFFTYRTIQASVQPIDQTLATADCTKKIENIIAKQFIRQPNDHFHTIHGTNYNLTNIVINGETIFS